jgi:hypothetical protein
MADQTANAETTDQVNGNSNGGHKTAVRAAAIAAATGATAFAAKKALSGRGGSGGGGGEEGQKRRRPKPGDDSMVGAMLESGWDAAKDSLLPFAEDAAGAAGEWVAKNAPDVVNETIVPRFIRGFEQARGSSGESEETTG